MSASKNQPANQPNREELIQMAITAARNNQKDGARMMFRQVLEQDRRNERAMMWMAKLSDTKAERVQWLQKVINVNPNNMSAKQTLQRIQYTGAARENRTLFVFGVIVAVLIVVVLVVVLLIATGALG
jgi:thioredoxin-like negative regulator of GroEL